MPVKQSVLIFALLVLTAMLTPTLGGQLDLFLALGKTRFLQVAGFIETMRAGHALYILLGCLVSLGDRTAAGMALVILTGHQIMIHSHALIKHVALDLPQGYLLRHKIGREHV